MKKHIFSLTLFGDGGSDGSDGGEGNTAADSGCGGTGEESGAAVTDEKTARTADDAPAQRSTEDLLRERIYELTEARRADAAANDYRAWMREAGSLAEEFPDFDIRAEVKDPRFTAMLTGGVDVRSAYTALHADEIISAAIESARSKMLAGLVERSMRPPENGISDQSASIGRPDISALSRSEVEAIERRVARGEKIYLK